MGELADVERLREVLVLGDGSELGGRAVHFLVEVGGIALAEAESLVVYGRVGSIALIVFMASMKFLPRPPHSLPSDQITMEGWFLKFSTLATLRSMIASRIRGSLSKRPS